MTRMLDRAALPAALVLAVGLIGKTAHAFPIVSVVPESSSISLLVPGLVVIAGFFLYKAIRAKVIKSR